MRTRLQRLGNLGVVSAAAALLVLSAACAQQDGATSEGGEPTTIGVIVQEWSVIPEESSAPAGEVTFDVENVGKNSHEFMVVATDLDLTQLPTNNDGSFDMDGKDVEVIDATNAAAHGNEDHAEIEPGDEKEFAYELDAGMYVLMCNLVDEKDDEDEVHFKLGMRIPFEVS